VTVNSLADLRCRLSEAYATQHADCGGDEAAQAWVFRRGAAAVEPDAAIAAPVAYGLVLIIMLLSLRRQSRSSAPRAPG
jgi:hypothetical protein